MIQLFKKIATHKKQLLLILLVGVFVFSSFGFAGEALGQERNNLADAANAGIRLGVQGPEALAVAGLNALVKKYFGIENITLAILTSFLTLIFAAVIAIEGLFIELMVAILSVIIKYNDFVNAPAVNLGWTLVRDLSNLFFVVVLLIISIGTILHLDNYNFKKMLPKILLMAVLVNFSLVIAGVILDAAQVIMLTFVAAFDETLGSNLFKSLHIFDTTLTSTLAEHFEKPTDLADVLINNILAVIFLFISGVTIGIFMLVLLIRMVAIWVLLVLSPLPYILYAFPFTQQYAKQWWDEFVKYVIVGPSLAFFLWLAFAVVNQGDFAVFQDGGNIDETTILSSKSIFIPIVQTGNFLTYVIAIAMLMAGLIVTQKLGVVGGSMAGSVVGKAKSLGTGLLQGTGKWALRRADDAQAETLRKAAPLRRFAGTRLGKAMGIDKLRRDTGLDILGREGFRFRTLPAAWESRSKRVEDERVGRSKDAAEDVMNRIFFSRTESDETRRKVASQVAEEQKEIESTSVDAEEIINNLVDDMGAGGAVKRGKRIDAEAKVRALTKDHNANELVFAAPDLLPQLLDKDYQEKLAQEGRYVDLDASGKGLEYTINNMQEVIRHLFANEDEEEQARIMFDVGEVGFNNKDPQLKYMAMKDAKTGEFKRLASDTDVAGNKVSAEKAVELREQGRSGLDQQRFQAVTYEAKKAGRAHVQGYAFQNMFNEERVVGGEENKKLTTAFNLSDFGLNLLHQTPGALTAEWHLASNEMKNRFLENADVLYQQMLKHESNYEKEKDPTKKAEEFEKGQNIGRLLHEMVGFQLRNRGGYATDMEVHQAAQKAREKKRSNFAGKLEKGADETELLGDLKIHKHVPIDKRKDAEKKSDVEQWSKVKGTNRSVDDYAKAKSVQSSEEKKVDAKKVDSQKYSNVGADQSAQMLSTDLSGIEETLRQGLAANDTKQVNATLTELGEVLRQINSSIKGMPLSKVPQQVRNELEFNIRSVEEAQYSGEMNEKKAKDIIKKIKSNTDKIKNELKGSNEPGLNK